MSINAAQIRAGRGLLNWTAKELAEKIGITPSSMSAIENGQSRGTTQTIESIEKTLVMGGVEFTQNGVNLRDVIIYRLQGADGFRKMMDDVFGAAQQGGDICVFNGSPDLFLKWLGADFYAAHRTRMMALNTGYKLRAMIDEGNLNLIGKGIAHYRWTPDHLFGEKVFYIYGATVAFIGFTDDDVNIQVIVQKETADTMRGLFNIAWQYAAKEVEE